MRKLILSPSECFNCDKFVNSIKAVRALTGLGLKESKAIIDDYRYGSGPDRDTVLEVRDDCTDPFGNLDVLTRAGVKARIEEDDLLPLTEVLKAFVKHGLDADNPNMVLDAARMLKKYS